MATIIQHEALIHNALKYILERRQERPGIDAATLLDEAGIRFNLSPLDQEALERLFRQTGGIHA